MELRTTGQICVDHHLDQLAERDTRAPAQLLASFRGVPQQQVDFCGAEELRVNRDQQLSRRLSPCSLAPGPDPCSRSPARANASSQNSRMCVSRGRDHEVFSGLGLQHQPHRLDIVTGKAPVTPCVEVPNASGTVRPFLSSATALVILRVTKVSPRRGDSWLNRIPLTANSPYDSL